MKPDDKAEIMHRFRMFNLLIQILDECPIVGLCTRFQANRLIELIETLRRELHL